MVQAGKIESEKNERKRQWSNWEKNVRSISKKHRENRKIVSSLILEGEIHLLALGNLCSSRHFHISIRYQLHSPHSQRKYVSFQNTWFVWCTAIEYYKVFHICRMYVYTFSYFSRKKKLFSVFFHCCTGEWCFNEYMLFAAHWFFFENVLHRKNDDVGEAWQEKGLLLHNVFKDVVLFYVFLLVLMNFMWDGHWCCWCVRGWRGTQKVTIVRLTSILS